MSTEDMYAKAARDMSAGRAIGPGYAGETTLQRTTFLNRLENAVSRLSDVADRTVGHASALTGGWPTGANATKEQPQSSGVFGAVEDLSAVIHRICDRIEEANRAVAERLP